LKPTALRRKPSSHGCRQWEPARQLLARAELPLRIAGMVERLDAKMDDLRRAYYIDEHRYQRPH